MFSMTRIFHWFFMWKMDPIRLVFILPPRDSTLQYKRCVHLWNNFPCIITLHRLDRQQIHSIENASFCKYKGYSTDIPFPRQTKVNYTYLTDIPFHVKLRLITRIQQIPFPRQTKVNYTYSTDTLSSSN